MPRAIAILNVRTGDGLAAESERILAEARVPRGVERESRTRFRSTDSQALFEYVSALVDRVYRGGRRAALGGRGDMSLQAGIALDDDPVDAVERAVTLRALAAPHAILAESAFVDELDPLRCLPFDRSSPRTVGGRVAYETFSPDLRDCFVVMPMGTADGDIRARSERVLDELIRPACQQLRLRPIAPSRQTGERISVDVFGALHLSSLTIAYLARPPWNPNVMIEAGYRLALGRPLVLLADEAPPFDLGDRRVVILAREWWTKPERIIEEIVSAMRDRIANGCEGGDLYPTAEIEIDERPVADERKRHRIAAASEATADLFGLPRDILVGMSPADLITHLGDLMDDPVQFAAFQEEQVDLYAQLGSLWSSPLQGTRSVTATVPLTFFRHPVRTFNGRAFLPCVIGQSRRPSLSSTQRVVYVEVTQAVRRGAFGRHGEIRLCPLRGGNGSLAFELYARSYDEILARLGNYREVRDRHVEKILAHCASKGHAARVLDVGAGTGNITIPLVEHGLDVCAIDISQAMLDHLTRKIAGRADGRLHVERRDCRSLRSFDDRSFDAVTMSLVLFAVGARDAAAEALGEAMRVLKPGGLLVVTEPIKGFRLAPLVTQAEEELRAHAEWPRLQRHWDAVLQANAIINPERNEFVPAEEIKQMLRGALDGLEVRDAYRGNCWTISGRKSGGE